MPQVAAAFLCVLSFGSLALVSALLVIRLHWSRGRSLAVLALILPGICFLSIYPAWGLAERLPLVWGHVALNFFGPYLLTAAIIYPIIITLASKRLPPPVLSKT